MGEEREGDERRGEREGGRNLERQDWKDRKLREWGGRGILTPEPCSSLSAA